MATTLGIKNNNPGNIRRGDNWKGLVPSNGDFCKFVSMEYGIRALIVLLRTYYRKYHLRTIRSIITRYAPPLENHTEAYIKNVSVRMGVNPDALLTLGFGSQKIDFTLFHLVKWICKIESDYDLSYTTYINSLKLL